MGRPLSRRTLLGQAAILAGGAIVLSGCKPSNSHPAAHPGTGNGLEGGTVVTDPASMPKKFNESPDFAALVQAGKLPPVAERIGQDPLVIKPLHDIGKYGGVIRRGYLDVGDRQSANRFCAGPDNLLYWDYSKQTVVPNIARGYEISSDGKELTLHLRRGMRWSDGQPFTADDLIFWRNDINLDPDGIGDGGSSYLQVDGKPVEMRKVDDVTVQFVSTQPSFLLPDILAGWNDLAGQAQNGQIGGGGFAPKHYLSQFLPKYVGEAQATKLAKDAGYPTWQAYVAYLNSWQLNLDLPVVTPWKCTRKISDPPWEFTANPYSIWVDSAGNQLPYIPKISMAQMGDADVLNLKAIGGEFDFQDRSLGLSSLQVLLKNQDKGNYTIHKCPTDTIDYGFMVNLAYDKDPVIGDLLRKADFRRALSLGIDRDAINQTFFFGTSVPTSVCPADTNEYFPGKEYRNKWATHDVAQANQLLDKLGLTAKDSEGWRLRPDGKGRLEIEMDGATTFVDGNAVNQLIARQYKDIGIYITIITDADTSDDRILSNLTMLSGNSVGTDDPFLNADGFLLTTDGPSGGEVGIPYAQWYISNGAKGKPLPDSLSAMKQCMDLHYKGLTATDADRIKYGKQINQIAVDEVLSIGVVGFGLTLYGFYLAKNNLKNVPTRVLSNLDQKTPSNTLPMTFYYA